MFGNNKASVCQTKIHEFGTTSVGVRAMFELFISLFKLLCIAMILAIPVCVVYLAGSGSEYVYDFTSFTKLSAASSGLSESLQNGTDVMNFGSLANFTPLQASELVSAFDFMTSLIVFLYLLYIRHYLLKIEREVKFEAALASSYTIEISDGLPEDTTETELIEHFSRLYALNKIDFRGRRKIKQMNVKDERLKYEATKKLKMMKKNKKNKNLPKPPTKIEIQYSSDGQQITSPLDDDYGLDETPVSNVDHNGDNKYLNSWVADVVLIRDEGNIIRHYQHLGELDKKVRHQRALVKKYSSKTTFVGGPNKVKEEQYMKKLLKLEFQQQQGLLGFKDPGPNSMPVVKAFVTFNNVESYERCISDYTKAWRRRNCCPCCPGNIELRFRYKNYLKVTPAPEPSSILYENQGEYQHKCRHRWTIWSNLAVVGFVLFASFLLILSTHVIQKDILPASSSEGGTEKLCGINLPSSLTLNKLDTTSFLYKRGTDREDLRCQSKLKSLKARYMVIIGNGGVDQSFSLNRYNISKCNENFHSCTMDLYDQQICPCGYSDSKDSCKHLDSTLSSSIDNTIPTKSNPIVKTFNTRNGDIAVCYCIQKLNSLIKGSTSALALQSLLTTDNDICSAWLEANAIGAGWSVGASFLIAIVNGVLGITISKKSKSSRPSSVSEENTQIFIIYLIAQIFNSIVLTILINAHITSMIQNIV